MSVYSTRTLTRKQAIKELKQAWKNPNDMTNKELEEALFGLIGREELPNSPLNNYRVKDAEVYLVEDEIVKIITLAIAERDRQVVEMIGKLKSELHESGHHIRRQCIEDIINLITNSKN